MAFCVGFVIALVLQAQLAKLGMDDSVPRVVWIILNDQLGPLLTTIVFIGRSVSGSAAELANMKIAEEIKALETIGIDVPRFLLLPILGAFLVMVPVMEVFAVGVGLLGAYSILAHNLGMSADQFVLRALEGAEPADLWHGLAKAIFFSGLVAMIAFHKGLNASGGSDEVGRVATSAVVAGLLTVTVANAIVTYFTLV